MHQDSAGTKTVCLYTTGDKSIKDKELLNKTHYLALFTNYHQGPEIVALFNMCSCSWKLSLSTVNPATSS